MDDGVLCAGEQGEECGGGDGGAVFAEDEGGGGAGDAELVGVWWVVVGAFWEDWMLHDLTCLGGYLEAFGLTIQIRCWCFGILLLTSCSLEDCLPGSGARGTVESASESLR